MNKRTAVEIAVQLAGLRRLKRILPCMSTSRPRYNQHDCIDAQGQVLLHDLTLAEIKAQYEDDAQGAAEDARFWADGGDVFSPVESWAAVERKALENRGVL